jgi:transposase InsO family protein
MAVYGVPEEVLTDNGTVFTGRFIKPRPAEVLFERICRENGTTQRLTRPASPTTTGKIERVHQSLQLELLDDHGPFESLPALQAALDAWRQDYNTDRPHQSLGMAFPLALRPGRARAAVAGASGAGPARPGRRGPGTGCAPRCPR